MKMTRWDGKNGMQETWLHHKYRELCSGSMNDRRWYHELALWFIYAGRRLRYRRGARHLKANPMFPWPDKWLTYSSHALCKKCGAGLAYHVGCGAHSQWVCADILTGRKPVSEAKEHDVYPFVFYEINSENQPSAYGWTTRPGVKRVIHGGFGSIFLRA